jgi:surface polysaccharide O-acyltransferase-like enzyme
MAKLNQLRGRPVNIDLVRTVAMIGVLMLHAAGRFTTTPQELNQLTPFQLTQWSTVTIYQSIAVPLGVPLFLMLSGALLLQPFKCDESLKVFWKKRWARIGLPSLFWGAAYFAWDFLVQKIPFSAEAIIQGILNGPYTQLWYLYVLVGLYLLTPMLRVFIANADESFVKYFIIIWILGVAILPFSGLFTTYELNSNVFTLTGYVGFFVLGTYLSTVWIRRQTLIFFASAGVACTALGTYILASTVGGSQMYFLQQYFSPTIILTAVMVFLLLFTIKPPQTPKDKETNIPPKPSKGTKLIQLISQNTLGIFFIHVIIIESIQLGYFGFTFNRSVLNPIIEVPVMTGIVLFASLGIILLLKKVPYLKRMID